LLSYGKETSFSIVCQVVKRQIAEFAKDYELHYANLTEYVAETEKIKTLAKDATTGFILQTGLAVTSTYSQTDFSTILYRF
jgi:hypothetical protein